MKGEEMGKFSIVGKNPLVGKIVEAKCERCNTSFHAEIKQYPTSGEKSSIHYCEKGDCFVECPRCARRYFTDDKQEKKFYCDRPLTVKSIFCGSPPKKVVAHDFETMLDLAIAQAIENRKKKSKKI